MRSRAVAAPWLAAGAPPRLAAGFSRLEAAGRGETVLVVARHRVPDSLLCRLEDARRAGAVVLALESGNPELRELADEALTVAGQLPGAPALWRPGVVAADGVLVPPDPAAAFEAAQHLVSLAAGEAAATASGRLVPRRRRCAVP